MLARGSTMKSGIKQHKKVLAIILLIVICATSLSGCSSTGSKTPEALVKRVVHAAITLDGEDLMDCILPELSVAYRMTIQLSASVTGQNPEKELAEEYYQNLAAAYELDGVDPKEISEQTVIISKEQDDITATVRALVILQIGSKYDYTEYYVVCSHIGNSWYFSNMFTSQPYGYTPTEVMIDDASLNNMINGLDQKRLAQKPHASETEQRDMIISAAIEKEVNSLVSKMGGVYGYDGKAEFTSVERMASMGFIDSIADAFSVKASVDDGGLVRGQDIVHDIAFEIMKADMSELSDKMEMLSAITSALSEGKKHSNALINSGHDESVKKLLEAAERSSSAYQFIQTVCDDNDLYNTYEKIRSDEVFMVFGDMATLFDYAQFMRRLGLGVSTASTMISLINNISDYEIAKEFADLYIDELKCLRDTTHSERLQHDLDTYIGKIEGGLVEKIKAYIDVNNTADGAKFVFDNAKAIYELSKNGFFGESLQKVAQGLTSSTAIKYFAGGAKFASTAADTPSLLASIFGYDSEEIVKSMDEMDSILPIYKNELDIFCSFGTVTNYTYQDFEDQYYLCLILGKAWCQSYLSSCNASMNHLEKIGLWSESDVRKAAKNIETFITEFDAALNNADMEHLEALADLCPDINWEVQY